MTASSGWRDFWDNQDAIDDAYWERHIDNFLVHAKDVLNLGSDDVVLDIGSGTGHFALAVAPLVREVHCVETSRRYAKECAQRLKGQANAHTHLASTGPPGPYDGYGRKFTRVNCLSVIQYFDSPDDVEAMLHALKKAAAPGALLLIGDIRTKGSLAADLMGSLRGGMLAGMLYEKLRLMWRMLKTDYRSARKANLMSYTPEDLLAVVERQGLSATFVDRQLTMNANRMHLLVRF